jgi:hypothetical protein
MNLKQSQFFAALFMSIFVKFKVFPQGFSFWVFTRYSLFIVLLW